MPSKRLASIQAGKPTSQHTPYAASSQSIFLPAGIYSMNMASTRFQSGIDPGSDAPAFATFAPRSREDRSDVPRHIPSRTTPANVAASQWDVSSALESFIDDRVPTIWHIGGPVHLLPKASTGRPLDAPISAEAIRPVTEALRPVSAPRERVADSALHYASGIDPGTASAPNISRRKKESSHMPRGKKTADGTTIFASAIDPGTSAIPGHDYVVDDRPRFQVPQIARTPTAQRNPDGPLDGTSRFLSAIDAGTYPPTPPSMPPYLDQDNAPQSPPAVDAGKLLAIDTTLLDVPRTTGIKPIDGDLLRKLFKHTMNEKRRAEEVFTSSAQPSPEELTGSAPGSTRYKPPKGFHIPDRKDLRDARDQAKQREQDAIRRVEAAKEAVRQQAAELRNPQPSAPHSVVSDKISAVEAPQDKSRLIRILAKSGEEAFVDLPKVHPSKAPSSASTRPAPQEHKEPQKCVKQQKQLHEPKRQESRQKQIPKPKQHEQQQPAPKKKGAKQHEEGRVEAAKVAAEALMSGALPVKPPSEQASGSQSAQDSGVGFGGMFAAAESVHSAQRSTPDLLPKVEFVASRSPSIRHINNSGVALASTVSRPSPRASSAVLSWEQVGEATFEARVGASIHSASRSTSKEESATGWQEVEASGAKPSSSRSNKIQPDMGWQEVGGGSNQIWSGRHHNPKTEHTASIRSESVRSRQSLGQGWFEVEPQRSRVDAARGGEPPNTPSQHSFQTVAEGQLKAPRERSPLQQSSKKASASHVFRQADDEWPQAVSRNTSRHSSTNNSFQAVSTRASQASAHGSGETGPARHTDGPSAHSSRVPNQTSGKENVSYAQPAGSDRSNIRTRSRDQISEPAVEFASKNGALENPQIQLSHEWTQRDAQHIEPWPEYEEPGRSSRLESPENNPQSVPASHFSHRSDTRSHSRRGSMISHQSSHGPSIRSEVHFGRSEASVSHRSLSHGNDDEPFSPLTTRNTPHAGRGWITPHPLSAASSVVAPESKIILPSEANPHGREISYTEWKEMQERGMRLHRNISITESSKTRNGIFQDERYQHSGWGGARAEEWEGPNPIEAGSQISSRRSRRPSNYRSPTVVSERSERSVAYSGSGWRSERHTGYAETIQESREASEHPSENEWEEMEEGAAGWGIS